MTHEGWHPPGPPPSEGAYPPPPSPPPWSPPPGWPVGPPLGYQPLRPRPPLPWGVTADGEFTRPATVLAFVLGTMAVFGTCIFGIIGIVLSSVGMEGARKGDPDARGFMIASWWCWASALRFSSCSGC